MKRKGFTLVELLAVIAILAILVIIALPNVMGMFNTAKENSFKTEVKEIYKTAQQQWIQDSMYNTGEQEYSRCSDCSGKSLNLSGRSELNYYIKLNKAGDVIEYYATDGTFQYSYSNSSTPLKIEGIDSAQKIADLNSSQVVTIKSSKPYVGGAEVVPPAEVKSFEINGYLVRYVEGMTWGQWVESEYVTPVYGTMPAVTNVYSIMEYQGNITYHYINNDENFYGISSYPQRYACNSYQYLTSNNVLYNNTLSKYVSIDDVISDEYTYSSSGTMC